MPSVVLEFAVRAALIALGTAVVLRLLRVKSAGARHAAWAGVLVLMLLLPAWIAWGPQAAVRVLPALPVPHTTTPVSWTLPVIPLSAPDAPVAPPRAPIWNWRMALPAVYLFGACILLARLAIGTLRALALVRRARILDGRLTSASCAAPVTVGLLRPVVILPESWPQWSKSQIDAVMAHEGEHVRRRDPLVQWLALLNRAIFWFHPLSWWLERRLSTLAEEACDAAVLARGCDPYDYSGYLLEMARSIERMGARVSLVGMAMPGSSLPHRIRQIIARGPLPRITRPRAAALTLACAMVSVVLAATTVDRQAAVPDPPMPPAPPVSAVEPIPPPPPPPVPAIPATVLEPPAPMPPQAPVPPPPPPPEQKYHDKRLLVLYVDPSGMTANDQANVIAAEQKFVREQMQSSDLVAVIAWHGGAVKVVVDFTADREKLVQDLQSLSTDSREDTGESKKLAALETAVKMLGVLPEKKALIYFGAGVQRTGASDADLKSVINEAVRANVAFYAIDARGIVGVGPSPTNRVAANDVVTIAIDNHLIDGKYTVKGDGTLSIPQLGDIKAGGMTPVELRAVINDRLVQSGILKDPHTELTVQNAQGVRK